MINRRLLFVLLLSFPVSLVAQFEGPAPFEISGGYNRLSNSLNGVTGSHSPMNGWDGSVAFPAWHNLRFKIDVSGYDGTNLGATEHPYFIMGGAQYEIPVRRETLFVEALMGEAGANRFWGANQTPGMSASIAAAFGGGLDTPISRHFRVRIGGDLQISDFALVEKVSFPDPFRPPGFPNYFGRITTGIVWVPRLANASFEAPSQPKESVESELIFEDLNSFGHFHIFANSWWSYLHLAGVEYDRHSWGSFIGARMDYVAEILPLTILVQPTKTNPWGVNQSGTVRKTNPGLAITPVGLRMLWRDGKGWMPFYSIKGGLIGFTQKSISEHASYENFTLQQSIGMQFRLSDRWDLRAALTDFHMSNGFVVPSNPGLDEMMYNAGLSYQLGPRRAVN